MKTITQRRYDILSDFNKVYDFLTDTYDFNTLKRALPATKNLEPV